MASQEYYDQFEGESADEIEAIKQKRLTEGTKTSYSGKMRKFLTYLQEKEPDAITEDLDLNFEYFSIDMFFKFIAEKQKGTEEEAGLTFSACSVPFLVQFLQFLRLSCHRRVIGRPYFIIIN